MINKSATDTDFNSSSALLSEEARPSDAAMFPTTNHDVAITPVTASAQPGKVKLAPMSPLAASSTVVNLILATGPFSYPQGFTELGPVVSLTLLLITGVMAYISATWLVEIISIGCTMDSDARHHSVFGAECYQTPVVRRKRNDLDGDMKESPFYIR